MSDEVNTAITLPSSLEFETIMREENLSISDLPAAIKNKISALKMTIGRFKSKPSENAYNAVVSKDAEIADDIQTFIEKEIEEEPKAKAAPIVAAPIVAEEPAKAAAKEAEGTGNEYLNTIFGMS